MAAQTWTSIQNSLIAMLSQAPPPYNQIPGDFVTLYPQATSYAEGRIYREIVPVNERSQNTSLSTIAASRVLSLAPTSQLVLSVEGFALLYPSTVSNPALATRIIFDASSLDVIDVVWPQESVTMDPSQADWIGRYWSMLDDQTIVFAPTVPAAYTVALTGNFAPIPISAANPTTYLSTVYPELLQAGCMVFLTGGLLRNFGAQSDDPKMATSWNSTYQDLLMSAVGEEQRRRMQGVGWSQYMPATMANKGGDRT
jgi:hypothetical protein